MKIDVDLANAHWTKSSLSDNSQNCLEVAFAGDVVALRDSKDVGDPEAKILVISKDDYKVFLQGIERGELRP